MARGLSHVLYLLFFLFTICNRTPLWTGGPGALPGSMEIILSRPARKLT
jgi:hypothetical protein